MKVYPVRNSFNSGEVSELTGFRDDISKYGGACAVLENAFPLVEGGARKMPGTFFAGAGKNTSLYRLVPFSRSTSFGNYILEFGDSYIRFWTTGANAALILDAYGDAYEVTTPYSEADLFDLDVDTQSADVLYIFHHLYPPMTLNHFGDANWTLTAINVTGTLDAATSSSGIPKSITGITNSNPAVVTCQGHGFATGSKVYINHVVGMVEVNYQTYTVTGYGTVVAYNASSTYPVGAVVSVGSYAAVDVVNGKYLYVATAFGTVFAGPIPVMPVITVLSNSIDTLAASYVSPTLTIKLANSTAAKNSADLIQTAIRSVAGIDCSAWTVTENEAYASSRPTTGITGVSSTMVLNNTYYTCLAIVGGSATNTSHFPAAEALWWERGSPVGDPVNQFALNGVDSTAYTPYISGGTAVQVVPLFAAAGDYPSCGALYGQRLVVGGSDNNPSKFWASVVGDYTNYISDPEADDYAAIFTLASQKVDQILDMIATPNALLMGTDSGVWAITGANGAPFSAISINAAKQTTIGGCKVRPQLLNDSAIFVSNSGRLAIFLLYNFVQNQWDNYDLTRLNRSITIGTSAETSGIVQTGFQIEPYPVFWAVRKDGQLLGLIFNKQDQVFAWFRINMLPEGGAIESVAVISHESDEDQVWISVRRNGQRGNEYFAPHEIFGQLSNAYFVHCGLRNTSNAPTRTVSGLTYLRGQEVVAVGDGSRLAVGGKSTFMVPPNGELTFDTPASQITVGLPYTQTMQPANLVVAASGGTSRGMKQKLRRVTLSIYQGVGGKYGTDPAYMYAIPYGESFLGNPPAMYTGEVTVDCDCDWDAQAKLIITNDEPFPFTLRGLVARLEFNPD